MNQIIKFGIVGTVGFSVDALVLLFFVHIVEYSIPVARLSSFLIAVLVTWLINRNLTFSKNNKFTIKKEYFLYLFIQTIGALINYIIFIILVYNFELFKSYLVLPLGFASIIVMFFNFFMLKKFIFSH